MIKIKKEAVLIKPKDIKPSSKKLEVIGTINPGAIRLPNGDIALYVRVIEKLINFDDEKNLYSPRTVGKTNYKLITDKFKKSEVAGFSELDFSFKDETKRLTFISHFRRVVLSKDGFEVKSIERKPSFYGLNWDGEFGVEDPRIIKIGDEYVMTYVTLSKDMNISTSYAISKDAKNWNRKGVIFEEQDKDVVIFPEKINGKYAALNRPEGNFQFSQPDILISFSNDLQSWGWTKQVRLSHERTWDFKKRIGAGPPPIKTEKGWLLIYHGVMEEIKKRDFVKTLKNLFLKEGAEVNYLYCVGAALLDLKNPNKVKARARTPIIFPKKKYEKNLAEGKDVVFPTGLVADLNGKDLLLYSGGGDVVTTVRKIGMGDVFKELETF